MVEELICDFVKQNSFIEKESAINDSMIGLKIFDEPLIGYTSANDELFKKFKEEYKITYGNFMPPSEWLENAKTVISIFFPYTQKIKNSNAKDMKLPSNEWLHGRYEGQQIIDKCTEYIVNYLNIKGYSAVAPCIDKRFESCVGTQLDTKEILTNEFYHSNWSERHVAFACGLGTFGLSKSIITKKGMAGRFSSIITSYSHIATERTYKDIYEYCTMCGKCISNCPVNAINYEEGKNHTNCSRFLDFTTVKYKPRYGCGKCQVNLPCSDKIPNRFYG